MLKSRILYETDHQFVICKVYVVVNQLNS